MRGCRFLLWPVGLICFYCHLMDTTCRNNKIVQENVMKCELHYLCKWGQFFDEMPAHSLKPLSACRRSCWMATVWTSCPKSWAPFRGWATSASPSTSSPTCPRFWSSWPPWRSCAWPATASTHSHCRISDCSASNTSIWGKQQDRNDAFLLQNRFRYQT